MKIRIDLIILSVLFTAACSDKMPSTSSTAFTTTLTNTVNAQSTSIPLEVMVEKVAFSQVPRFYSATGYTNVSRTIEISTSQSASIHELKVKEGDLVKQGDLLIALDESELLTSIRQAESTIESAQIRLKDLAHDLRNANQLIDKRVITLEQLRKVKVQYQLAETHLTQAKNELERQLARKPYHRIDSPIAARVIKRWVEQGDLAVIGKPLLQLEALAGLEFETAIPAKWVDTLKIGDHYSLTIHNRQEPITAIISHIVNSVDRVTQTCQIKLALSDSDTIQAGLSGQINFVIAKEDHLLIPKSALIKRAGVFGVFRALDDKAVFTPVNTEREWQDYYVVLSGLNENDNVVISPPSSLKDGSSILIQEQVILLDQEADSDSGVAVNEQ